MNDDLTEVDKQINENDHYIAKCVEKITNLKNQRTSCNNDEKIQELNNEIMLYSEKESQLRACGKLLLEKKSVHLTMKPYRQGKIKYNYVCI